MQFYRSWKEAPQVPPGWESAVPPGAVVKVPVRNEKLLKELRRYYPGGWKKIYRRGKDGSELHYFQHTSGTVFNVKLK